MNSDFGISKTLIHHAEKLEALHQYLHFVERWNKSGLVADLIRRLINPSVEYHTFCILQRTVY